MRIAMCGLVGTAALLAACGGAKPASEAPRRAGGPPAAPVASCERRHPGQGATRLGAVRQGSTVALARAGSSSVAYVADEDDDVLHTIDVESGIERATTPLAGAPSQVMVLADGRVAVALRDKNRVQVLEPAAKADAPLVSLCEVNVPAEPVALAATPDEKTILVSSAWGKKLSALDAATLKKSFDVDVAREPRAVLVDDDGQRAFVAHVVGAKMSVVDLVGDEHAVREIDLRARKMVGNSEDAKLRGGCQGFALAKSMEASDPPKGEQPKVVGLAPKAPAPAAPKGRVFAPMVTVDPGETTVRSSGYGNSADQVPAETPIVSVIDASAERALTRTAMSDGARRHSKECILPRAAAYNPTSSTLLLTCLGTDALVELDARGLDPARLERRRWSMPAGPTGVAVDAAAGRAVVWSQFDRELAVVDLDTKKSASAVIRIAAHRSAKSKITPQVAWGRELFHKTDDPRISQDGRACASCHPDGREDALTWSTPDGPRQTIMLAGRLQASAPFSWSGTHDDVKTHVNTTFQRLGGVGLPDHEGRFDELDALSAYLEAMPSPSRVEADELEGQQKQLAARGKDLFFAEGQGCASCHVGGGGTDREKHDVGSAVPKADPKRSFDTPTLRFVGGTAPYFHDGRYATLDELLAGSDAKMGHTMHLSRRDVVALKTYLETL